MKTIYIYNIFLLQFLPFNLFYPSLPLLNTWPLLLFIVIVSFFLSLSHTHTLHSHM